MDNLLVFADEDTNPRNGEKPPHRVCPRCHSDNTKFCYFNNYRKSQPRYNCKNCRRHWTHGGALRNVPIGGGSRKIKKVRVEQPPASRGMIPHDIQQFNPQHFPYLQENNDFVGSFGAAAPFGNHFGLFPDLHGGMLANVPPFQSFLPNYLIDYQDVSFEQDFYDVGSVNPMINQSIGGGYVDNPNGYLISQVDQYEWSQLSFNNTAIMDPGASTSGSRGPEDMTVTSDNIKRLKYNRVIKHPCHLEKHGP
ncbi:hypothetical protein CARUB_v10007153mg [Capsella rubella]|uniref:Dof zinc finger protein n=1 Tax=Capsella rubella TaxID=81985 RepID=R0GXA8_9BRAS|nr:dof zinc finger protein DOF4.3 [Capsella rubella]EOA15798.1 hypothetical protein CARUB_v10007153mg [Capsella rubella]